MSKVNQLLNKDSKNAGRTASKSLSLLSEEKSSQRADKEKGTKEPEENESSKLLPEETKEGSRRFSLKHPKTGKRIKWQKPPQKQTFLSNYVAPEFLRKKLPEENLNERQKEWRKNVVTNKSLHADGPSVVKPKLRLGLRRYLFVNEWLACKEGMLYYLLPLVTSLIFLFNNINHDNFIVNAVVAVLVVINIVLLLRLKKSNKGDVAKILLLIFLVLMNVLLFVGLSYVDGFYPRVNIWFSVKLVTLMTATFYFARFYVYFGLSYASDLSPDFGNAVRVVSGPPGCGKTSKSVNEAKVMALLKWQKLQLEFHDWISRKQYESKRWTQEQWLEFHAIEESYTFYAIRAGGIPCLWSNIAIEDDKGRRSLKITLDHIRGVERLPNYCVVLFDEIGAVLSNELSKEKSANYDIADMFRLGRHFLNWHVICCEQDYNNVFISIRRVVGVNELLSSQEWVGKPVILYNIYKFIDWWIADGLDKQIKANPLTVRLRNRLKKFVYAIGFRCYRYQSIGNTQTLNDVVSTSEDAKIKVVAKSKIRYVPAKLLAKYDDRAYKQLYPAYFDNKIKGTVHESLSISGANFKYGSQFISGTTLTAEKRAAIETEVKKLA